MSNGLSDADREIVFSHIFRHLASYRNVAEVYILTEHDLQLGQNWDRRATDEANDELNKWAQNFLHQAWIVCKDQEQGCPILDPLADTSTRQIPPLPDLTNVGRTLNTIAVLEITTTKSYSAYTRVFLHSFGPLDEYLIGYTLRNPAKAIEEARNLTETTRDQRARSNRTLRMAGMGLGAVAGGLLVGITGGLAAPLVGAGVTSILGLFGAGGTAAGLLASSLASSSVVCGALFGAYGARSAAGMVSRHAREVSDFEFVQVLGEGEGETLGVRLCISGWLTSDEDITAPWTIFRQGDDTHALQWEKQALKDLSSALVTLVKSQAWSYAKGEIIKHTALAGLLSALSPIFLLKIGKIIEDNPWMNAKALALKTGRVLGELLALRVFGNRPVTLTGFSLGSLVIFQALLQLSELPPAKTCGLIQDVFLFGTPVTSKSLDWATVRRVVCGRVVNGFCPNDMVLGIFSRASSASWNIAGLQAVEVPGVENIEYSDVDGHLQWRGMVGKCLRDCKVPGVADKEVEEQLASIPRIMDMKVEGSEARLFDGDLSAISDGTHASSLA
ncbi:DUF726-domain-containing protein [Coniophora puteana RWD-64-598 SS2]|uniref:DUF726-domain-containing protein n=1 Tax=Coniophora puteana (strain RWD-64-598) TaxID=741705 RepID=A0A5M3N125_CONPW|nr:DUF726-domain-containing protein [Coniophora puteana RWD-64-598 SS2]EIW85078.1 DUF726-domain-containing protein [Coniophora puteana RWD-64-598 SS2]